MKIPQHTVAQINRVETIIENLKNGYHTKEWGIGFEITPSYDTKRISFSTPLRRKIKKSFPSLTYTGEDVTIAQLFIKYDNGWRMHYLVVVDGDEVQRHCMDVPLSVSDEDIKNFITKEIYTGTRFYDVERGDL